MLPKQISTETERALPPHSFLLLTSNQWMQAVLLGLIGAAVFWPFYRFISPWLGAAVFLTGVIMVHMRYACRFILPFPHIALMIVSVQYIIGAWVSAQYPSHDPLCNIGMRLPVYLEFATLVLVACIIGWGIALSKIRPSGIVKVMATTDLLTCLDALILIGFVGVILGRGFTETNLNFVFILLGNLRFVGVFGRMLCKGQGWTWRLVLVFVGEILFATSNGMFGNFIIWGLWAFALWVFLFTPSWWKLATIFAFAVVMLPALHESKWQLRDKLFGEGSDLDVKATASSRSMFWLSNLGSSLEKTVTGNLDDEFIGDAVARYNQGWIIDRIIQFVPACEPYANGATLKDAFIATLLPRILMPNKVIAGGKENMQKFAGLQLEEGVSMNLGYAGELYANFGYWGGIIGCLIYTLLFGLLFRWISVRAFASPLWWSVMPYVGFMAVKTEDGIAEVMNWTFKASLVMLAVCFAFPEFRRALFMPEKANQKTESRNQKPEVRRRGRVRSVMAEKVEILKS